MLTVILPTLKKAWEASANMAWNYIRTSGLEINSATVAPATGIAGADYKNPGPKLFVRRMFYCRKEALPVIVSATCHVILDSCILVLGCLDGHG